MTRHTRNGPAMDVALCGARGSQLSFSKSLAGISCEQCKVHRASSVGSGRLKREAAARSMYYKGFAT